MATVSSRLIVIASTKIGENSVVLHTLSREYGRRGFVARPSPNVPAALFQPLSLLEAEMVVNPKSELWRIRLLSATDPLNSIRADAGKSAAAMFVSELLYRVVREGAADAELWDWLENQIITLDRLEAGKANFHLLFLLGFAARLGFRPEFEDLAPFAEDDASAIRALMTLPYGEALLLPLNGEKRSSVCEKIINYLEYHTESRINLRSLPVLGEIFR